MFMVIKTSQVHIQNYLMTLNVEYHLLDLATLYFFNIISPLEAPFSPPYPRPKNHYSRPL